jgi:hypothetical protein
MSVSFLRTKSAKFPFLKGIAPQEHRETVLILGIVISRNLKKIVANFKPSLPITKHQNQHLSTMSKMTHHPLSQKKKVTSSIPSSTANPKSQSKNDPPNQVS